MNRWSYPWNWSFIISLGRRWEFMFQSVSTSCCRRPVANYWIRIWIDCRIKRQKFLSHRSAFETIYDRRGTTNVFHIGILLENSLCCFPDWWKRQIDCLDHHMVIAMMISSACKQSVFLLLICNLYAWLAGLEREGGRPSVGATVGLLAVPVGSGPKHSIHTSQPNCIFKDSTFYSSSTN